MTDQVSTPVILDSQSEVVELLALRAFLKGVRKVWRHIQDVWDTSISEKLQRRRINFVAEV